MNRINLVPQVIAMAKPGRAMCDKIPDVLRAYAKANNYSMRELCLKVGKSEGWINQMFKGEQVQLKPYGVLADYATAALKVTVTIDDLVVKIRAREMSEFIAKLKNDLEKKTRDEVTGIQLAKVIGVSDGLLRKLAKDTGELKGLNSYVILAEAYELKIEDLRKRPEFPARIAS